MSEQSEVEQREGAIGRLGRRALDLAWPGHPRQWRDVPRRLRPTLGFIARLTAASTIAFVITAAVTGTRSDLTGALTALLVVQASNYSTLKMGLVRVAAVLTGVLVAILLSNWWGLAWWSLAMAIAASLLIAKVLRLGDQALEAPISAMLILAVHAADMAVETRLYSTLIGTAVGIAFSLLMSARVPTKQAAAEVRRLSTDIAAGLHSGAASMRLRPVLQAELDGWFATADALGKQQAVAARWVAQVSDSRRLNPRAVGAATQESLLRSGLATLNQVVAAVRALLTVLRAEAPVDGTDDQFGIAVRPAFAVVLDSLAESVIDFGELIEGEIDGRVIEAEFDLRKSLERLRETRAILTELMMVDPSADRSLWLLRGSVLAAVEQILRELDVVEREKARTAAVGDNLLVRWRASLISGRSRPPDGSGRTSA